MNSKQKIALQTLFNRWLDGDVFARDEIVRIFHKDLSRLASYRLRKEPSGITLETGDLVNEVILRIFGTSHIQVEEEVALKALSAKVIKNVLIDHARKKGAKKRSGIRVQLSDADLEYKPTTYELLELDQAIQRLAVINPIAAEVILLRFFGNLTISDTSIHLNIPDSRVRSAQKAGEKWLAEALAHAV